MIRGTLAQVVRKNRRSTPFKLVAQAARKYLQLWNNADFYDFEKNGEAFVLRTFATWNGNRDVLVWDVGAHFGEWASEAHALLPTSQVVSFEIMPEVATELAKLAEANPWLTMERSGLSDREGTIDVVFSPEFSTTNAVHPRPGHMYLTEAAHPVPCPITTGDRYLERVGGPPPHFLKIDTEGHESFVLQGCRELLARADGPVIIQFEYGDTYIPSGSTLQKIQGYLEDFGFAVGRLYPDHVAFAPYSIARDDFQMGNLIAVRDPALRDALSG